MATLMFLCLCVFIQAVEELLESLDLEKSSYHMGLSRVSKETNRFNVSEQTLTLNHCQFLSSLSPNNKATAQAFSFFFMNDTFCPGKCVFHYTCPSLRFVCRSFYGVLPSPVPTSHLLFLPVATQETLLHSLTVKP